MPFDAGAQLDGVDETVRRDGVALAEQRLQRPIRLRKEHVLCHRADGEGALPVGQVGPGLVGPTVGQPDVERAAHLLLRGRLGHGRRRDRRGDHDLLFLDYDRLLHDLLGRDDDGLLHGHHLRDGHCAGGQEHAGEHHDDHEHGERTFHACILLVWCNGLNNIVRIGAMNPHALDPIAASCEVCTSSLLFTGRWAHRTAPEPPPFIGDLRPVYTVLANSPFGSKAFR